MKLHTIFFSACLAALCLSCSKTNSDVSGTSSELSEDSKAKIIGVARRDAAMAAAASDPRKREAAILDIKAKESSLRNDGLTRSADLYVKTAHAVLDSLDSVKK